MRTAGFILCGIAIALGVTLLVLYECERREGTQDRWTRPFYVESKAIDEDGTHRLITPEGFRWPVTEDIYHTVTPNRWYQGYMHPHKRILIRLMRAG